jgi:hypothetical protein
MAGMSEIVDPLWGDRRPLLAEIERLRAEVDRLQTGWELATKAVDTNESLRAERDALLAALRGMIEEWERLSRYGSPMAKAANPRVNAARAAIANVIGRHT